MVQYRDPNAPVKPLNAPDDDADTLRPWFKLGCIQLVFRVYDPVFHPEACHDFVLVRKMALTDRDAGGDFPYLACEENVLDFDKERGDVVNKLGRLWTWERGGARGRFRVLSADEVHETVAIMPRWKDKDSDEWSIETGVHEHRYCMDARNRPPFIRSCPCDVRANRET